MKRHLNHQHPVIQAVAPDVLRHRLVLSFEAEADGVSENSVIERLLDSVGVP